MVELRRFWVGGKTEGVLKAGRARILISCSGYEDMNKLRITSAQKCMISLICEIGGKKNLMNITTKKKRLRYREPISGDHWGKRRRKGQGRGKGLRDISCYVSNKL